MAVEIVRVVTRVGLMGGLLPKQPSRIFSPDIVVRKSLEPNGTRIWRNKVRRRSSEKLRINVALVIY